MRFPASLGLLLVLGVAFAGCGAKGGPESDPGMDPATRGAIEGVVVDDESLPVGGALIALKAVRVSPISIKSYAGPDGRFRLENLPAGRQTVEASKAGYHEASTTVTVLGGETAQIRLVLTARANTTYTKVSLSPITGHYDCALEYVTETGSCDREARNATGQGVFQTKNNASFQVPADWGGLLFEIRWTTGSDTSTLEGVRFFIESKEEPGGHFVRTTAQSSPIRVSLNAGDKHPTADLGYGIPQRGLSTWIKLLPQGKLEGATCAARCGYGAGAALNLEYEVFPTIFYGGPVDPAYSALPAT